VIESRCPNWSLTMETCALSLAATNLSNNDRTLSKAMTVFASIHWQRAQALASFEHAHTVGGSKLVDLWVY
jgi:hypothetical protein